MAIDTSWLESCLDELPDKDAVTKMEIMRRKIIEEAEEVSEATLRYIKEPTSKNLQMLGEEIVDAMTANATYLDMLDQMEDTPEGFKMDCLCLVSRKNHARGYWGRNDD